MYARRLGRRCLRTRLGVERGRHHTDITSEAMQLEHRGQQRLDARRERHVLLVQGIERHQRPRTTRHLDVHVAAVVAECEARRRRRHAHDTFDGVAHQAATRAEGGRAAHAAVECDACQHVMEGLALLGIEGQDSWVRGTQHREGRLGDACAGLGSAVRGRQGGRRRVHRGDVAEKGHGRRRHMRQELGRRQYACLLTSFVVQAQQSEPLAPALQQGRALRRGRGPERGSKHGALDPARLEAGAEGRIERVAAVRRHRHAEAKHAKVGVHRHKAGVSVAGVIGGDALGGHELSAVREILLAVFEDVVEDRHHATLRALDAVKNEEAAVLHRTDDRPVVVAQVAAGLERALLQELRLADIAMQRHVFYRHLDQRGKCLAQPARVRARWRRQEHILPQLPLLAEEFEVLQHDRVLRIEHQARGRDALRRIRRMHGDRDVRSQTKRAELRRRRQ